MRRCVSESAADVLVVGYGNDLRSDDGAGRWVADRLEDLALDGVEVRSMSQLTPEVALLAAGRRLVVFVDASVDADSLRLTDVVVDAERPGGAGDGSVMTHHGNPASVLEMTAAVGRPPDRVVLVSIPATDLEMGFAFTPPTAVAAERAVAAITELIVGLEGREHSMSRQP